MVRKLSANDAELTCYKNELERTQGVKIEIRIVQDECTEMRLKVLYRDK